MKWHPHASFALPGVVALFLVAVLQGYIPPAYRPYVFVSVILTLLMGLVTGQFRRMSGPRVRDHRAEKNEPEEHTAKPEQPPNGASKEAGRASERRP